jgi:hypothetical protein
LLIETLADEQQGQLSGPTEPIALRQRGAEADGIRAERPLGTRRAPRIDPRVAAMRQVFSFEAPDLTLDRLGV